MSSNRRGRLSWWEEEKEFRNRSRSKSCSHRRRRDSTAPLGRKRDKRLRITQSWSRFCRRNSLDVKSLSIASGFDKLANDLSEFARSGNRRENQLNDEKSIPDFDPTGRDVAAV